MFHFKRFSKILTFSSLVFFTFSKANALNVHVRPLSSGPHVMGVPNDDPNALTRINLWGRAQKNKMDVNKHYYIISRVKRIGEADYEHHKLLRVHKAHDRIDVLPFDNLTPDTNYRFQIGSFAVPNTQIVDEDVELIVPDWTDASGGTFKTPNPAANNLSFVFGSCRRYINISGITLFDSGAGADRVFGAIFNQTANDQNSFFLRLGDNVYFDPIGEHFIGQERRLNGMRKLYRTVQNFPLYANLLANRTIFSQKDDHDTAFNNVIPLEENNHADIVAHGAQAFFEYQKWDGPHGSQKMYYSFSRGPAEFFVLETREERDTRLNPKQIISPQQLQDFQNWIRNPAIRDKVKFIVSPGPFLSGGVNDPDTWAGFPEQQRSMIETILGNDNEGQPITKAFVLVGDGHCTHGGTYSVHNAEGDGPELGRLTEIMSSGLKAINYGRAADFPAETNLLASNGLRIIKIDETPIFPDQTATDNMLGKIEMLFNQNVDSVFVRMDIDMAANTLTMNAMNQNQDLLDAKVYHFDPAPVALPVLDGDGVLVAPGMDL